MVHDQQIAESTREKSLVVQKELEQNLAVIQVKQKDAEQELGNVCLSCWYSQSH